MTAGAAGPEHRLDRPSANAKRSILAAAVALYVMGTIGSNVGPAWLDERPAIVLALSARNRNLFGSVPFVDPLAYSLIGFIRILVVGVVLYLVGRWYGGKAIQWMEGQLGELPAIYRWSQKGIDRAGWLLVLLMPGSNLVCLLAGHRRMNVKLFSAMMAAGAVLKLIVLWIGGRIFEDQIRSFLDFIEDYQWYIVIGLFALTFLQSARRVSKSAPQVLHEIEHPSEGTSDTTPDPAGEEPGERAVR